MIRKEIRDQAIAMTRETDTINTDVENWINDVLSEIQNPGWAYTPRREHDHLWNFNRRKTTLTTVATQEDYELPRDLDRVGLLRQTTSPTKIFRVPDEVFYRDIPNPTATGNPRLYRLWTETGLSTSLAVADTIDVVSDSASDGTSFTVSIVGYIDGIRDSEVLTLNGTTVVTGSKTWDASRSMRITKSGKTTGTITVTENSGGTTILTLGPEERGARFQIVSFYPIPASEITVNLEYFTTIRRLVNDTDEPDFDEKWHYVVLLGVISKIRQYQQNESQHNFAYASYASSLRGMVEADEGEFDYIPKLRSEASDRIIAGPVKLADTVSSPNYGSSFGIRR